MMLRIGVDARILCFPPRGVGNFARNLLASLAHKEGDWGFVLFVDRPLHPSNSAVLSAPNLRLVTIPPGRGYRYNTWQQVWLQSRAWRLGVDLMYYPAQPGPLFQSFPSIVTFHDTKGLRKQRTLFGLPGQDGGRILPLALRKARRLITVSEYTRRDLIENFRFPPGRLETIYQGIGPAFRPLENRGAIASKVRERYGLRGRYLFSLGCLGAGSMADKNTSTLLQAVRRLRDDFGERIQLVVAGLEPDVLARCEADVRRLGLGEAVRLAGYVSEEELVELYNCAELFVFPSLDEGFGLPPIEAMACGSVVVASNATSIPEATGGLAFLVDCRDARALAERIKDALDLVQDARFRSKRVAEGLEWASRFRWAETAKAYVEVFRKEFVGNRRGE